MDSPAPLSPSGSTPAPPGGGPDPASWLDRHTSEVPDPELSLYALKKQASFGDCTKSKPNMLNVTGRRKHVAWLTVAGMSKGKAREQLAGELDKAKPGWRDDDMLPRGGRSDPPTSDPTSPGGSAASSGAGGARSPATDGAFRAVEKERLAQLLKQDRAAAWKPVGDIQYMAAGDRPPRCFVVHFGAGGKLGLNLKKEHPTSAPRVKQIDPAGQAAQFGVEVGDILLAIGDAHPVQPQESERRCCACSSRSRGRSR